MEGRKAALILMKNSHFDRTPQYPFVRILGCCFEQEPDWPEVWGGDVAKGPRYQGLLHSLTKQEFLGRSNLMHEPRGTRKAHSKHGSHGIQGTDMASISVLFVPHS